jgi:hypothetical protein
MLKPSPRKTRMIWQRLNCLKSNPMRCSEVPAATASDSGADLYVGETGVPLDIAEGQYVTSVGLAADNESE